MNMDPHAQLVELRRQRDEAKAELEAAQEEGRRVDEKLAQAKHRNGEKRERHQAKLESIMAKSIATCLRAKNVADSVKDIRGIVDRADRFTEERKKVFDGLHAKLDSIVNAPDPDIEGVKRRIAELKVKIAQRQKVFDGLIAQFKKEDEQYQRLSKQYLDLQAVYLQELQDTQVLHMSLCKTEKH